MEPEISASQLPLSQPSMILPMLQLMWRPMAALQSIHRRYGDRVLGGLFGRKILFLCAPQDIEQIFNLEGKGLLSRDFLHDAKKPLFGNGLVNSPSEIWSRQRRLMQPLFTKDAVKAWETVIVDEADRAAQRLLNSGQQQVNLSIEIKRLIQRIFFQVLLGKPVNQVGDSDRLLQAIDRICRDLLPQIGSEVVFGRWFKQAIPVKFKRYYAAVDYLRIFIRGEIAEKRQSPGQGIIAQLLLAEDRSTAYRMPDQLLEDEAVNLFFAGQETTINSLLWFFYLTGKHDEVREKILAEVRSLPDGMPNSAEFERLVYTKAALNEAMRLYPPTAALSTQTLTEIELAGQRVAAGTTVLLSMYATHRHPRLWDQPEQFKPERFLEGGDSNRHRYAFFPFGGGLHNCIGKHFAELEMLLIVVVFFRRFGFATDIVAKEAISVTLKPDRDIVGRVQ